MAEDLEERSPGTPLSRLPMLRNPVLLSRALSATHTIRPGSHLFFSQLSETSVSTVSAWSGIPPESTGPSCG